MMTRRGMLVVLATLALFLLTGCGFLSHTPSRFYSLDRIGPQAAVASVRGLPIGIEVVLPPGFDRKEVVVRQADHRLEVRGTEQWTTTLEPLVLHTLAFDLAARLPDGLVILPGEAKPAGAMRSLDLVVEELAAGPDRRVVLDARWILRESGQTNVTHKEHIAVDIETLESANIASGISQVLATLADHIVAQVGGAR